jgi:hypothetical protein
LRKYASWIGLLHHFSVYTYLVIFKCLWLHLASLTDRAPTSGFTLLGRLIHFCPPLQYKWRRKKTLKRNLVGLYRFSL